MPQNRPNGDRTPAQRQADHASLARLSESLVPALVQKLAASGLGELEVHEGEWRIRLRRAPGAPPPARRPVERPRLGAHAGIAHADRDARGREAHAPGGAGAAQAAAGSSVPAGAEPRRTVVTSPAVGVFRPDAAVGKRVRVGDRIATVDLLGIPQDVTVSVDGTLTAVFAQAGEAVEYGEEVAVVEADVLDAIDDGGDAGAEGAA